ncbi:hypothetical protein SAMN02910447_02696 [Ruminococcus sp. YE71]|uniref:hypothetical protein n=1 Tax=unclassified Ruminococcus TaxID=2608920 RepID=UPI0008873E26|nr:MULTISPECIES: hypothetical protein [unclassified Ruminococcus]SDA26696.1 hypothetical protein SAMN02910446_02682 [Ruminococcus sp. YE78]SFW44400.1 hypothetical protein SAMN02910447_02696 [Ruminococcus sp. YE71]
MEGNNNGIVLQKKHIVIIAALLMALLLGGVVLGVKLGSKNDTTVQQSQAETQSAKAKPTVDLDPNAGEYTGELPKSEDSVEDAGIQIPGYPSITIAKDTQDVKMALLNPEGNLCYFKFEIALKDTDETIFESKYVEPGSCIYDVHLSKPLAEGEYPAVIKISTIALDGETPLNGANVETVLVAK